MRWQVAQDAVAVWAALLLLGGTLEAADILPALGLVVVAIGVTQAATRGIGRAVWIVTSIQQRGLIEMLVAPVVGKDGDGAMVVQPLVVGGDIIGRIPQLDLPGPHRHGEFAAMRDELGALIGVGRIGGVAHGQFQSQVRVEIGGFEVHVAKDFLFLGRGAWCRRGQPILASRSEGILGQLPMSSPLASWLR